MEETLLTSCQEIKEINDWLEKNIMVSRNPKAQAMYTLAIILNREGK